MRRPRSGAAPQAGSRSCAEGARRRGGPESARPAFFPQPPKVNFAAPSAALQSPRPSPRVRCDRRRASLRQGLAPSPGARPRRHGLDRAGAGRRAVRPAGGAARPRRSLLRGGVLLQGKPGTAASDREAKGWGPGAEAARPTWLRFLTSSCSSCSPFRGKRGDLAVPTPIRASVARGRFGLSFGATTSLVAVLTGRCPPSSRVGLQGMGG